MTLESRVTTKLKARQHLLLQELKWISREVSTLLVTMTRLCTWISSSARFQEYSKVLFEKNVGKSGGAVTVLGHSSFEIRDNSMFMFDSNNAREMGGAISQLSYSVYQYILSRSCFLHYTGTKSLADRNISFSFRNNRVGQGHEEDMASNVGHTIFSSSLHPCFIGCVELTLSHYNETFDCIANFTIENKQSNDISSIGEVVTQTDSEKELTVIPGESIQLPISLKDDLNNSVVALYHITIMNNNNSSISITNDYTSNNWLQLFGNPGDTATLHGQTQAVWEVAFTINIRMRDALLGSFLIMWKSTRRGGGHVAVLLNFRVMLTRPSGAATAAHLRQL